MSGPKDTIATNEVNHARSPTGRRLFLQVKEFMQTLVRLWTNPIYMLITFSTCFIIFTVGGSGAYTPKYMERVFDLPASKANYIMAAKSLSASCVGTFVGGYLSKRLKMTALSSLVFVVAVNVGSTLIGVLTFFVYCDQPETYNAPGSNTSCSSDCQCEDNTYFPVCGADGRTYYSPCSAGCQTELDGTYNNCTCIDGGTASGGICSYSCNQVYYFAVISGLRALLGTLSIVPKITITIRSVQERDKPLALGFATFMTSLLGWLMGPLVFGIMIDGICVIWDINCNVTGRCLLYDNDVFRLRLHGFSLLGVLGSLACQIIALVYAKCTGCLDTKNEKSQTTDMPLMESKGSKDRNCDTHGDGEDNIVNGVGV